jgi:ubiquitin-like-conjugating enzyme ATG3
MSLNNKIKHSLYEKYKEIVVSLTNPISRSEFQNSGKLTPNEFIEAGNMLIQKFPAWEWCKGSPDITPSLPNNKKYLKLSGVASKSRPSYSDTVSLEQDGWEITEMQNNDANNIDNDNNNDIINFEDEDEDRYVSYKHKNTNLRMYDLTLVYDVYYSTPRLYLIGYDCNSNPLSGNAMMEDVFATVREKTVTIEFHPFLKSTLCISIHPCRHSETMKRIMQSMEDKMIYEQELLNIPKSSQLPFYFPASMSLFVFLKFMSSIIPTIDYDVSIGIEL